MDIHQPDFEPAAEADADGGCEASWLPRETQLEFLTRRALEESRLANQARSPQAAAAHRYLAAAYSHRIAHEAATAAVLESLLSQIA